MNISYNRILKAIEKVNDLHPECDGNVYFRVFDDGSGGFYFHNYIEDYDYIEDYEHCVISFGSDTLNSVLKKIESE